METNVIIMIISYLIFFAMFIAMPFRQKKIIQQAGKEVLKIHKKISALYVLVFMLGFLIIAISVINNFSIVMQSVFCVCALFGEEIAILVDGVTKLGRVQLNSSENKEELLLENKEA